MMKIVNLENINPYAGTQNDFERAPWNASDQWPCKWVQCRYVGREPFVAAYRKIFTLDENYIIRVHVSADERYELFVDGRFIGRGSERGDKYNWYFESYDLELEKGDHVIVARTWSLKWFKPAAQISIHSGFIFSPQEEKFIKLLGTGVAEWEAKVLEGYSFVNVHNSNMQWVTTGAKLKVDGNIFAWGFEKGKGSGWLPVIDLEKGYCCTYNYIREDVHALIAASLPPQLEELKTLGAVRFVENLETMNGIELRTINIENNIDSKHEKWNSMLQGNSIVVEPNSFNRIIIDLEDYYCIYPRLKLSGGRNSFIRVYWSEALYFNCENERLRKGNRNIIEGSVFRGLGDEFVTDGGAERVFDTLWWHSGRYIELIVKTSVESLIIDSLELFETRYPLYMESKFKCSDKSFKKIGDISFRTLQMCAHETYMDCPYYEQLMYVGDTRLQALITYVCTLDSALPRKAINTFKNSTFNPTGLIKCAYPEANGKVIPSFCLWWVGMVYDYALWRGDRNFIRTLMPTVRNTVETYMQEYSEEGLLFNQKGWNFYDWANNGDNKLYEDGEHWSFGIPGHNAGNINSIFNWHMVLTLKYVESLEEFIGEPEMAARAYRLRGRLADKIIEYFWDNKRGLFADDLGHTTYSEHSQCLAILSGQLGEEYICKLREVLNSRNNLMVTSIYFSHYVIETLHILGCEEAIRRKLNEWMSLEGEGLCTTPEVFADDTRSDCHAWGGHPLYHIFSTILGIRPKTLGFETVLIKPSLLHLSYIKGTIVHPQGNIKVEFEKAEDKLKARVNLPKKLTGALVWGDKTITLDSGEQEYVI